MSAKKRTYGFMVGVGMIILILDSRTAISGATDGITLCCNAVIPALFPFFILSPILSNAFTGQSIPVMRPIAAICGIPKGAESLFLIGLFGGYPVGAGMINDAYQKGNISKNSAQRLLGFCCNAGPAFLFGMLGQQFRDKISIWILWAIHIFSAIAVGCILPGRDTTKCKISTADPPSMTTHMYSAIRNMAGVCGWVIIFRVLIAFINRWFLWLFPAECQVLFAGLLELSNGCCELKSISLDGFRFILSAAMIAFGGLCVTLQTLSVTPNLHLGVYLYGKFLQTILSVLIALPVQSLIYTPDNALQVPMSVYLMLGAVLSAFIALLHKKTVAFPVKLMYNGIKSLHNRG